MDRKFESYLNLIKVSDELKFKLKEGFFTKYYLTDANKVFVGDVQFPKLLDYLTYEELFNKVDSFSKLDSGFESVLNFKYTYPLTKDDYSNFINSYINKINNPALKNYKVDIDKKEILFEYSANISANGMLVLTKPLVDMLYKAGAPLKVCLGLVNNSIDGSDIIDNEFEKDSIRQNKIDQQRKEEYQKQLELDKTYVPCKIKDAVTCTLKRVEVCGNIFEIEIREIKNHTKKLAVISYEDGSYGVVSNLFEGKRYDAAFIEDLKVGDRIKIKGTPKYDDYAKQVVIGIDTIEKIDPLPKRMDNYEGKKRIELHLHTNMSTMDGTCDIKDYVKTAISWGWDAIGMTDHGNVQNYPGLQDTSAGKIKPLYGCELYMVDTDLKIALNPQDIILNNAEYVVFDLETTGLSSRYDRIIEFGATKVRNGQIVDNIDFFINPDFKLSSVTTNLTHITDEMVRGGYPIKKALQIIKEFVKDSILVAHNAVFDYGFLNVALENNGMEKLTNPVIDTLPLSRVLFQDIKSHNLGSICKKLGVTYLENEAHRAVYDATVLKECWDGLETSLINMNAKMKHSDLNNIVSFFSDPKKQEEVITNLILSAPYPYHVVAYAKDKQGLKDLFELISIGNTKYIINAIPRISKSLLTSKREHLLLGSACFNGEVFQTAMTRSKQEAQEVMKYYDYIEVQPLTNYSFLVNDGQLTSTEHAQKIVTDIISMAKEINKIVVATSDCHYLNPEDKIFRDVFIFAKGLKGARHPLNPFRRDKMKYYDNPDQYLRTTQEMLDEFKFLNDDELAKEIVIDNTHVIADMLSSEIKPIHDYLAAPIIDDCDKMLTDLVKKTAHEMYGDPLPKIVEDRLNAELSGISANHFEVIYWIASKLVRQANADGYIVGSRGSVGSSLVATMSGITEVNPLQPHYRCPSCKHSEWLEVTEEIRSGFDLDDKDCPICGHKMIHDGQNIPFATFLGFHAEKTPDIDLNFPGDYQAHAHELTRKLLTEEYGNSVYKAGTIECVAEKNAIGYAKGYYENLQAHPELHISAESISKAELARIAKGCIGVKRTTGQHPGGIIVIPRGMDYSDFTPIQYPADDKTAAWTTSHFDYNQMHDTILKLDELGHVDPLALRMMSQMSNKNIYEIPMNDKNVMSLFTSTKALKLGHNYLNSKVGTMGMPEFGTRFAMQMLEETKPVNFADLVIISGLAHGTNVYAGNQQNLINDGVTTLRGVIGCRDDIMMNLHNYYGIAFEDSFAIMEMVRKGKFNAKNQKMHEKYEKYTKLMKDHNVPDYFIDSCNKIAYLFPKGHAVAYCMMCVRVGWFKVYDPLSFYATYFSVRADQYDIKAMIKGPEAVIEALDALARKKETTKEVSVTDKDLETCLQMALEMLDRGFKFENIDIYKSEATTFVIDKENNALIPPFSSISGIGEAAAQTVIEARKNGEFTSIEDFSNRTKISAQKVQELKEMGVFKDLPESSWISLF